MHGLLLCANCVNSQLKMVITTGLYHFFLFICYFAAGAKATSRSSSTLPGNISVVRTPLPEPPSAVGSKFSPEMERYLLSPEVVELLRCKPKDPVSGMPLQEALIEKGLAGGIHTRTFSYPNSLRTSTGSSVDSPVISQRSSQDQEYFSARFSASSTDGYSDSSSSFTYDTPTNNQLADAHTHPVVPSHYDVPRSLSDRAQVLSNNYMVPRLARMSDPLFHYDYLPPPRPATHSEVIHPQYDYLPKRDPPITDVPLPPRTADVPIPPEVASVGVYDVPPQPRPLVPQPSMINGTSDEAAAVVRRDSVDSPDCPRPQQGELPPPQIIFRRDSKGNEMIPNKMYEMVWAGEEDFVLVAPDDDEDDREELEDTLTVNKPTKNRQYVNLCVLEEEEEGPPPIDRSLKPRAAPKIDRSNKPRSQTTSEDDRDFVSIEPAVFKQASLDTEEMFSPREIPRLTSHSVHYAQVSFDRKKPVPTPRSNRTPTSSPQRRVNYCHIDIDATNISSNPNPHMDTTGTTAADNSQ